MSTRSSGCRLAFRLRLFGQTPRVAVLFELIHHVVGHGETLVLAQGQFQAAHDLGGAAQCERNLVAEQVAVRTQVNDAPLRPLTLDDLDGDYLLPRALPVGVLGQQRTCRPEIAMSALPPKADIG